MTSPQSGDVRHRRWGIAVAGCAVLAVLAMTLLLLIGMRHVPDLPTVEEQPAPPITGRLALQIWDEDEGTCIDVQDLGSGERRHVWCEGVPVGPFDKIMGIAWFGWSDEGRLQLASYEGSDIRLITFDVDTDAVVDEEVLPTDTRPPDTRQRADGSTLTTRSSDDGRAAVYVSSPAGDRRTLYEVRGPDGYSFWSAQWSTRGDHAVVRDSEGRWIVLRVDGDPVPRILTDDADQLAWYEP